MDEFDKDFRNLDDEDEEGPVLNEEDSDGDGPGEKIRDSEEDVLEEDFGGHSSF